MYLDPDYRKHLEKFKASVANSPELAKATDIVMTQPTAIWLDTSGMLDKGDEATGRIGLAEHLRLATAEQNAQLVEGRIQPMAIQIVTRRHPISQLKIAQPDTMGYTEDDLKQYKNEFIDKLKELVDTYPNIRFIVILEPQTIPDLLEIHECKEIQCQRIADATDIIRYGINTLGNVADRNIYLYLGIGHSAWLISSGKRLPAWLNSLELDIDSTVKGFATNTAAYVPLHEEMIIYQPSYFNEGFYQYRSYLDEKSLIEEMDRNLKASMPNSHFGFITDASRNGWGGPDRPTTPGGVESRLDRRKRSGNWCNVSGAGIGRTFEIEPTDIMANMHAYTWLKQPGYSDGVPEEVEWIEPHACDPKNGDALEDPPQGGMWFEKHFIQLLQNSWPKL